MHIVYRHIVDDKVIYIGMGKPGRDVDFKNRSQEWFEATKNRDVEAEVLWECEDREEAYQKEIEFIELYGRKDLNEGALVNKTNGGGWLQGLVWGEERREKYAQLARKNNNLTIYVKENGAPNKGKTLGPRPKEVNDKSSRSLKESWKNRDAETIKKQTRNFRENNPSFKVTKCPYCNRDIQGASAYKRFHGENCKNKTN